MNTQIKWQHIFLSPTAFAAYFLLASFSILVAQGPFFLHQNGDVNYNYLLVGLDYLYGETAAISDQPALFTKLWNALTIGIVYSIRSVFVDTELKTDVIQNAELYLYTITIPVVLLCTYSYWRLLEIAKRTFDPTAWLAGAVTLFVSSTVFLSVWVNKPEPYLLIAGLWISVLLIKKKWLNESVPIWQTTVCILFAILSKITILPLLLPFLVVDERNQLLKIVFSVLISLAVVVFIWYDEFTYFSSWILNTALHTGVHGGSEKGFWDMNTLMPSIIKLIKAHSILLLLIALGTYISISKRSLFLGSMTVGYILFILIILKNPSNHYFVPCYALLTIYVLSLVDLLNIPQFESPILMITLLTLGARALILGNASLDKYASTQKGIVSSSIQTYYSSSPSYALFFANKQQKNHFTNELTSLYPNDTFYWFDNQFYTHKGPLHHGVFKNRPIHISGTSDYVEKDSKLRVLKREEDGVELHYTVQVKLN